MNSKLGSSWVFPFVRASTTDLQALDFNANECDVRFVTAHLDPLQPPLHKRSMYALAQETNLPAVFVDIRHDGAHGEMPSVDTLRDASERALEWLWDHYWDKLEGEVEGLGNDLGLEDEKMGLEGQEVDAEEAGEDEKEEQKVEQVGGWKGWEGPWVGSPIGVVP